MTMNIPNNVKYIMDKLEAAGYEAYLVGGCVRDFLMGKEPKDYDVATNATPQEMKAALEGADVKIVDTGVKFGTLTVIRDSLPVEVTTYRAEGRYSDGRHPDEVAFSETLAEDLSRRDFAMNAVAFNETSGFVDPFNGMVDIENRVIRCVGDPEERFSEDALRIMRAIRFSSSLDFDIEEGTKAAIFACKSDLEKVSRERIQKELTELLCGTGVERVLREYYSVIGEIIPEILPMVGFDQKTPYHIYDVWEHTIKVVTAIPPIPVLRFSALFHDIGKPPCFTQGKDGVGHFFGHPEVSYDMADEIMRRLKFSNDLRNDICLLVRWHDLRPESTDKSVRKVLMKVTPRLFEEWIEIKRADNRGQAPFLADRQQDITDVMKIGRRLIDTEGTLSLKSLNITGKDIMAMGVEEGPEIGRIMDVLLSLVLEERILNDADLLAAAAAEIINQEKD